MPRGLDIELIAEGFGAAGQRLDNIADALEHIALAAPKVYELLQRSEQRLFERYGGRYVRTGALRDSLAGLTSHSIREAHANEIIFGTNLYYARFLRRGKRSAVLSLTPRDRAAVGAEVMDMVMGSPRTGTALLHRLHG